MPVKSADVLLSPAGEWEAESAHFWETMEETGLVSYKQNGGDSNLEQNFPRKCLNCKKIKTNVSDLFYFVKGRPKPFLTDPV